MNLVNDDVWPPVHRVWKFENPHCGAKNQSCRKYMVWPIKTCARRAESQWKKINRAYQFWEKAQKLPKNAAFPEYGIFGKFLGFSSKISLEPTNISGANKYQSQRKESFWEYYHGIYGRNPSKALITNIVSWTQKKKFGSCFARSENVFIYIKMYFFFLGGLNPKTEMVRVFQIWYTNKTNMILKIRCHWNVVWEIVLDFQVLELVIIEILIVATIGIYTVTVHMPKMQ